MNEGLPSNPKEAFETERARMITEIVLSARELVGEIFPFPGIDSATHDELRAFDDPDYATPIDDLIEKCQREGIKVVLPERDPESGNVFILPAGSDDIERDSLLLQQLLAGKEIDARLRELILQRQALGEFVKSAPHA